MDLLILDGQLKDIPRSLNLTLYFKTVSVSEAVGECDTMKITKFKSLSKSAP